jgi:hypothetical protein
LLSNYPARCVPRGLTISANSLIESAAPWSQPGREREMVVIRWRKHVTRDRRYLYADARQSDQQHPSVKMGG